MTQDTRKIPAVPETPGAPTRPSQAGDMYRSIADGELATPWSLPEYFASLNTVLRLPSKVRRKAAQAAHAAQESPGGIAVLALLNRIRLPKPLLIAGAAVAVAVLVVRPLVLSATGGNGEAQLSQVFGVWQATTGKYKGRTFEVSGTELVFRTSSKEATFTRHPIEGVTARTFADSTRFTVTYVSEGQPAEFAFWYVTNPGPVIRFVNQHDVSWTKAK